MIPKRWWWICRTRETICIICIDFGESLLVVLPSQTGWDGLIGGSIAWRPVVYIMRRSVDLILASMMDMKSGNSCEISQSCARIAPKDVLLSMVCVL